MTMRFNRRTVVGGLAAAGGAVLAGCGRPGDETGPPAGPANVQSAAANPAGPARRAEAMTVYRDPSCGCCEAWAEIARAAGHEVRLVDHPDMAGLKRRLGVPEALASCHTAVVASYVIEGHVPLEHVAGLLERRPPGVRGLAVPGMPRGSPGMEMPDGARDPFEVLAFDAAGRKRQVAG